jgi:hypothetical protein
MLEHAFTTLPKIKAITGDHWGMEEGGLNINIAERDQLTLVEELKFLPLS